MNAVWLNDELMVAPATVAGLDLAWTNGDAENWFRKCRWYITVVWISGTRQGVWWGEDFAEKWEQGKPPEGLDSARTELKVAALAEMERLSELLWPTRKPVEEWNVTRLPDLRIYDPELYGLPFCNTVVHHPVIEPDAEGKGRPEFFERCNLAAGHPGDHRFGPTFDETYPTTVTLSGTVFGTGGGTVSVLVDRDAEEYPDLGTRVEVRASPEKARQCGSMSNAGYRCELPPDHEQPHWGCGDMTWTHSDHV